MMGKKLQQGPALISLKIKGNIYAFPKNTTVTMERIKLCVMAVQRVFFRVEDGDVGTCLLAKAWFDLLCWCVVANEH